MCLYYFLWLNTTRLVASTYFSHSRSHQWPLSLFLQLSAILHTPSCKRKGGGQRFTSPLIQSMPLPPSPLGGCCPALTWFSTIFSIVHSKGVGWGTRLTLSFGWIPLVLRMDRIGVGRSLKSPLWQIRKRAFNQGSNRRSREEDRELGVICCLDNRRKKGTTRVSGSSLWEYGGTSRWDREIEHQRSGASLTLTYWVRDVSIKMETSNSQFQLDMWVRISNMNHKQRKPPKLKAGGLGLSVGKECSLGAIHSLGCFLGKTWKLVCFSNFHFVWVLARNPLCFYLTPEFQNQNKQTPQEAGTQRRGQPPLPIANPREKVRVMENWNQGDRGFWSKPWPFQKLIFPCLPSRFWSLWRNHRSEE